MRTLLNKKWKVKNREKYKSVQDVLLESRGVKSSDDFLNPKYESLLDPFLMKDMTEVVDRIEKAKAEDESIVIYGDYDVDGVTSATLLRETLERFGISKVDVLLPHRVLDGYGLNKKYLKSFVDKGVSLLITVDNGTAAIPEIDEANNLGLDVIVMDHHQPHDELPNCLILNPLRKDCDYPDKNLCGVGIVFKFLQAMDQKSPNIFGEAFLKWNLDIVALGTVADCARLVGENRIFVYFGIKVLRQTKRLGLKHLMKFSEIDPIRANETDIGFKIAPRLNAAGRVDEAISSFYVLFSNNEEEVVSNAFKLQELNTKRRSMTNSMMLDAYSLMDASKKYIFVYKEDWHAGVIGLVAGNLAREFGKPTFVLCKTNDGVVGSVRAPECSLDIMNSIKGNSKLFVRYGGHKKAAGFCLEEKNIESLNRGLDKYFEGVDDSDLETLLDIDIELSSSEVNQNLMSSIEKVSPFGEGNKEPVFILRGMKINNVSTMGNKKDHLRFIAKNGSYELRCVGFGLGKYIDQINKRYKDDLADIVFTLHKNIWQGKYYIDLRIEDLIFNEF